MPFPGVLIGDEGGSRFGLDSRLGFGERTSGCLVTIFCGGGDFARGAGAVSGGLVYRFVILGTVFFGGGALGFMVLTSWTGGLSGFFGMAGCCGSVASCRRSGVLTCLTACGEGFAAGVVGGGSLLGAAAFSVSLRSGDADCLALSLLFRLAFGNACSISLAVSALLSGRSLSTGSWLSSAALTGSPFPRSNIEMSEFVGGMGSESTASLVVVLTVPTLTLRLGVLVFGVGLTLRLAASVAAMKLGLLGSGPRDEPPGCRSCWCWCWCC